MGTVFSMFEIIKMKLARKELSPRIVWLLPIVADD
jgi:hypothetical protein